MYAPSTCTGHVTELALHQHCRNKLVGRGLFLRPLEKYHSTLLGCTQTIGPILRSAILKLCNSRGDILVTAKHSNGARSKNAYDAM